MNIRLFGNRYSGHTYKVALFLTLNQIPYTYQRVSLTQPRPDRPQSFRKNARFDEVPALLIDETPFVQSNAILHYLSQKFQCMDAGELNYLVIEWLNWEQSRIGFSLPNLRFELKFKSKTDPAVVSWIAARLKDDLGVLDSHLEKSGSFVVGNAPSIADCSLAGYLYWLADADFAIHDWPNVEAWLDRMSCLENWQHPDSLIL